MVGQHRLRSSALLQVRIGPLHASSLIAPVRIMNPILQSEKSDETGDYIRHCARARALLRRR